MQQRSRIVVVEGVRRSIRRGVSMLVVVLIASGCSGDVPRTAGSDGALLGPSFETVSDAATGGDFAVVFDVVAERDFAYSDISRPADGSPPTSPPQIPDDDYVGRVVRVVVDTVVWERNELAVPSEFEFVTAGWTVRDGSRAAVDDGPWYRVEVGRRYFGVFTRFGEEIGPMSIDAIYAIDGDQLVEVSTASGPDEFDGATLTNVAQLLETAVAALPPDDTPPPADSTPGPISPETTGAD